MVKKLAVFDFDGTLYKGDSLFSFAFFSRGCIKVIMSFLKALPWMIGYVMHLCTNDQAKEKLFSFLFSNMDYEAFCRKGSDFVEIIEKKCNKHTLRWLKELKNQGYRIIIISASCPEWISPWASLHGVDNVIGTEPEVLNNKLTGYFKSPNCFGIEKVIRLISVIPNIDEYDIEAFTDSIKSDYPLISISCRSHLI